MNPNTKIASSSQPDQIQSGKCPSPCYNQNPSVDSTSDSFLSRSICSATDCTGLIPALPDSEAELEAYEEMYQFCMDSSI